jgi:chemotaxis response regulator CheB
VSQETERPRKIRVLIVEDSMTVREGLFAILAAQPDIEVVGAAEDGKRAIELCLQARPDVITMDMMLPMMSGLSATEYIMAHCPTPILVVSASINRGELFKIYEAGNAASSPRCGSLRGFASSPIRVPGSQALRRARPKVRCPRNQSLGVS